MAFEFIGHADDVAKQQQLWGAVLLGASALLAGYTISKGKPAVYWGGVLVIAAIGVFYLYQWSQLKTNMGEWIIRADDNGISWRSPDESIDRSFNVSYTNIEYIDRSAMLNPSDHRRVYHLILRDGDPVKLNAISGVDLEALVATVANAGIEIRETNDYYLPVEERNK
ncbi:MAG: hypothetical protein KTR18_10675 [Acidiferrobacterales bacterium]|nr:hypothetical protein [Acidiferrobacterales bacterium]